MRAFAIAFSLTEPRPFFIPTYSAPPHNIFCINGANSAPSGEYDPGNSGYVDERGDGPPANGPDHAPDRASFDAIITNGFNIISLGQLTRNGFCVYFEPSYAYITAPDGTRYLLIIADDGRPWLGLRYVAASALTPRHDSLVLGCPHEIGDYREFLIDSGSALSALNTQDRHLARDTRGPRVATNYDGTKVPHHALAPSTSCTSTASPASATKTTRAPKLPSTTT